MRHLLTLSGWRRIYVCRPSENYQPGGSERKPQRRYGTSSRVVLRSKWQNGRRFDLARLLGDRVASPTGRFFPATRAHTYRQKVQRSFAAELLSPFESVDDMLGGDFSVENREDVAEYFQVSEWTIRSLLVNHHRLEREDLEVDFDEAVS